MSKGKKLKKLKRFLKHPLRFYINSIKHSIVPKPYSHQVKMNILIKKGQQNGTALIPCTIYAMDHGLDLNPALIRKKDKKIIKVYKPGKKIKYDSNKYVVELTEDEKEKGYVLKELERCSKCGQKLVIAEVKATRYRSCPSINIKLGDPAKKDVIVPVEFGVNKADITRKYWFVPVTIILFIIVTFLLFGYDPIDNLTGMFSIYKFSEDTNLMSDYIMKGLIIIFLWIYLTPRFLYGTYKTFKWYHKVKPTMKKTKYAYY